MTIYKRIIVNGKEWIIHRYVYAMAYGPIPDGYVVHHVNNDKLDNRLENLALMTYAEHADHHNRLHPKEKECSVCHEFYEPPVKHRRRSRTCSAECFSMAMASAASRTIASGRISDELRVEVRRRVAAGEMQKDVAASLEISRGSVSRIVHESGA